MLREAEGLGFLRKVKTETPRPKEPSAHELSRSREVGTVKVVAFDQSHALDDFMPAPEANSVRTSGGNGVVTFPGNFEKNA